MEAALMSVKFFVVPASDSHEAEEELNSFLARHRIVGIDRRWVDLGASSFWALCVDHLPVGGGHARRSPLFGRNRVDYKQILSAEEFAVFSRLRELRKEIAQAEAVPVYAVLTNEQLAMIVQSRCRTAADLGKVEGVGQARVEKYGARIVEIMAALPDQPYEANGPTVRANS
jgi:superfamily II DNA helicase RecQ